MPEHKRKTDEKKTGSWVEMIKHHLYIPLLLAAALLGVAILATSVPLSHNRISNENNAVFAPSWQYRRNSGAYTDVSLPASLDVPCNARLTLRNYLPEEAIKGATILLRTSQQDVEVCIEHERIYTSHDKEKDAPAPSSAYHFVRLPTDCSGKEITITLCSPLENYSGLAEQIYIGSKTANLFFLLREHGGRFMIGFLIFIIGFLLMMVFLWIEGQKKKTAIICLGAFFTCAGYWVLVESRLLQLLIPYPVALTNSSFFALTLLPLFSGMYYYNTHATHPRSGKWVMILAALASASFAAITCVRPMAMPQLLPYYLFFMGLYILAVLISILLETLKIGRFFSASFCGVIGFGSCAVVELALYFSNMKGYHPSDFLTLGLLWFSVAMAVDTIQNLTHVYQAAVKVETLSILAYTDGLTGLKNRTAFLERMSTLGTGEEGQVTLTMFDINDLKVVNDTSGHLVGDAMLRHGAKAIGRSLRQEDELYRIGGDEFVAVICHDGLFNCRCIEDRMRAVLQEENQKALSYRLNIACGCATFEKSTDKTLFETLSRADKNMYACKQAQKNAPQKR